MEPVMEQLESIRLDRNLALEAVRVTEAAARAAARLIGCGDEMAADQAAVDAIEWALREDFLEGLRKERARSKELKASLQSKAQRHLFFAQRMALTCPCAGSRGGLRSWARQLSCSCKRRPTLRSTRLPSWLTHWSRPRRSWRTLEHSSPGLAIPGCSRLSGRPRSADPASIPTCRRTSRKRLESTTSR